MSIEIETHRSRQELPVAEGGYVEVDTILGRDDGAHPEAVVGLMMQPASMIMLPPTLMLTPREARDIAVKLLSAADAADEALEA